MLLRKKKSIRYLFSGKKVSILHFCRWECSYNRVLGYAESDGVIFIKIVWFLGDCFYWYQYWNLLISIYWYLLISKVRYHELFEDIITQTTFWPFWVLQLLLSFHLKKSSFYRLHIDGSYWKKIFWSSKIFLPNKLSPQILSIKNKPTKYFSNEDYPLPRRIWESGTNNTFEVCYYYYWWTHQIELRLRSTFSTFGFKEKCFEIFLKGFTLCTHEIVQRISYFFTYRK